MIFLDTKQMLDFLQWPCKSCLLLIIGLFLITSCSGLELGVSPPEIVFSGKQGDTICKEIKIFSDKSVNLVLNDSWSEKKLISRNINDYNYNNKKFGITADYHKRAFVDGKYASIICLSGENSGRYYGLLKVNSENGNVGLGTWLVLNLSESGKRLSPISKRATDTKQFNFLIYLNIFLLIIIAVLITFHLVTK
ncbi:MAG: hypothetical protein Q7S27_04895 [Nanoarchaeota archaeon]|nr:hypothetical protein [Nanoarchaeota archaeon]